MNDLQHTTTTLLGIQNTTLQEIQDSAIRNTWIIYFLFVFLSSVAGDTLILVSSIKHRAFKLHPFIVSCIQHIAVADLLVVITAVLPRIVSLVAEGWVLGDVLCAVGPFVMIYPVTVSILLICVMATSKLVILKFPIISSDLTSRNGHMVCGFIWMFALNIPTAMLVVDKTDVTYDFRTYTCHYRFSSPTWNWLEPFLALINSIIPNIVVVCSTIPLMVYLIKARQVSRRIRGAQRWQGILTTFVTVAVYSVSALPYSVYRALESQSDVIKDPDGCLFRVAVSFLFLNTVSNFYIYLFTVPSFRNFLAGRIDTYYSSMSLSSFKTRSMSVKSKFVSDHLTYLANLLLPVK